MKRQILVLVLCSLLFGCYTEVVQNRRPKMQFPLGDKVYFLPDSTNYGNYEELKFIYRHWIFFLAQDKYKTFIPKNSDTAHFSSFREEYIFYSNGFLRWLYLHPDGTQTFEEGKWGLNIENPLIIKIVGATANFTAFYTIKKITSKKLELINGPYPQRFEN